MIRIKADHIGFKALQRQKSDTQKELEKSQRKIYKYDDIKSDLERIHGNFLIEIKERKSQDEFQDNNESRREDMIPHSPPVLTSPNPMVSTPPQPQFQLVDSDFETDEEDFFPPPPTTLETFPVKKINNGESFLTWISSKGKCKALYPFEIAANGSICISHENEFWVAEEKKDVGWNKVHKVVVEDKGEEHVVPLLCLEKCALLEHRFLFLEQPVQ